MQTRRHGELSERGDTEHQPTIAIRRRCNGEQRDEAQSLDNRRHRRHWPRSRERVNQAWARCPSSGANTRQALSSLGSKGCRGRGGRPPRTSTRFARPWRHRCGVPRLPGSAGLITATVNFAQAAKEAGVSAVINLSQRSADRHSKSDSCKDTFIAEQVLNWSGLAVTHLRPTYFLEWLLYPWQLPLFVEKGIIRLPAGKGKHAPIGADDQGRVIAAILQDPGVMPDRLTRSSGRSRWTTSRWRRSSARAGPQDPLRGRPDRRLLQVHRGDGGASLHRPAPRRGDGSLPAGVMGGMNDNVERLSARSHERRRVRAAAPR